MRINSSDSMPYYVGDNRHEPISLSSLNALPYHERGDEHRRQEYQVAPKQRVKQTAAYKRALAAFSRLRSGA